MSIISDYVPPLIGLGTAGAATYYRYEALAVLHAVRGVLRVAKWNLLYWHEYFWPTNDHAVSEQTRQRQAHPGYLWGGDNSVAMMNERVARREKAVLQAHYDRTNPSYNQYIGWDMANEPPKSQAVIDWERQHHGASFARWLNKR